MKRARRTIPDPNLLTGREVADMFRVTTNVVAGWADAGKLNCIRTLGNHRRYFRDQVLPLLHGVREGDKP